MDDQLARTGRVTALALVLLLAMVGGTDAATPYQQVSLPGFTSISTGWSHTCASGADGSAWCWGSNGAGQLGDGTTGWRPPSRVQTRTGFLRGVRSVAAGTGYSCAVMEAGTARCWGSNYYGELGDGTDKASSLPVSVTLAGGGPLTGVTAISAGFSTACAVREDRTAWCWGFGSWGTLGNGSTKTSRHATQVQQGDGPLTDVRTLDAGVGHVCAIKTDGSAWCWGLNGSGELGDGTRHTRLTAVPVLKGGVPLTGVRSISAGGSYAFDYGTSGARTGGLQTANATPAGADAASGHTCAALTDGSAWCWGAGYDGRLGDGKRAGHREAPVRVITASGPVRGIRSVTTGVAQSCAMGASGTVWCWGSAMRGDLGDGTRGPASGRRTVAVRVLDGAGRLSGATTLQAGGWYDQYAGGYGHACVVRTDGRAYCWGANSIGQIGDWTRTDRRRATPVAHEGRAPQPEVAVEVEAGASATCALRVGGAPECWGFLNWGPYVPPVGRFRTIRVGSIYACGIRPTGRLSCWGDGGSATPPDGRFTTLDVAAGIGCAIRIEGDIRCWGAGEERGLDDRRGSFLDVAVSGTHACAIRMDRSVTCWGTAEEPVEPPSGRFRSLSADPANASIYCGVTVRNRIVCWGSDSDVTRDAPTGEHRQVDVGADRACALTLDGRARCWGDDSGRAVTTRTLRSVTVGETTACGLLLNGKVACWGRRGYQYQRGDPVKVLEHPEDERVPAGRVARFTAQGTGWPYPSVRWEVRAAGSDRWVAIPHATGTSLTFTARPEMTGDRFRAVFTSLLGTSTSTAAGLVVTP